MQKGSGPSEWNERVFLLPKQNVKDARSDMYEEAGVVSMARGVEAGGKNRVTGCSPTVVNKGGISIGVGKHSNSRGLELRQQAPDRGLRILLSRYQGLGLHPFTSRSFR